jgi:hypothetical protein
MTDERQKLVRREKLLGWLGVGWHGIEVAAAAVAVWLTLATLAIFITVRFV